MSRARRGGRGTEGRGGGGAEGDEGAVARLAAAAGESDGRHGKEANRFVAKAIKSDVCFMKTNRKQTNKLGFK